MKNEFFVYKTLVQPVLNLRDFNITTSIAFGLRYCCTPSSDIYKW